MQTIASNEMTRNVGYDNRILVKRFARYERMDSVVVSRTEVIPCLQ
jgi:hypothetical protein